jgi:NADH-quinone oxidoreductase subunit A
LRRPHDPSTLGQDVDARRGVPGARSPWQAGSTVAATVPDLEGPMTNPYVPILVLMGIAAVLALGGVGASAIIGPKRYNRAKLEAYECGIDPTPHAVGGGRFPIKYYLVAMTFIVFDIEVVFMYPWAVAFSELAMFGVVAMITFIVLITVPFVYEWRRGGFEWD